MSSRFSARWKFAIAGAALSVLPLWTTAAQAADPGEPPAATEPGVHADPAPMPDGAAPTDRAPAPTSDSPSTANPGRHEDGGGQHDTPSDDGTQRDDATESPSSPGHGDPRTRVQPAYYLDGKELAFTALAGSSADQYYGALNGAGYRIEVPENWNGELVMWAHGFAGDGLELTVDDPPFRQWLLDHHFAWAASSYQRNGYVPTMGASDTYALAQHFARLVAEPTRVYITGASMGGHITGVSIERYPGYYAGALPVCGVMADRELFDYFTDANLGALALTGISTSYPFPSTWSAEVVPQIKAALAADPSRLAALRDLVMYRSGGPRPYFESSFAFWLEFLLGLGQPTPGVPAFPASNEATFYELDDDPATSAAEAALNERIQRVDRLELPTPDGVADVPVLTGEIDIPVLTLHTIGDLFVPFSMQQGYHDRVAAMGRSDLLVQRAIRDIGHCAFSQEEWDDAISDLVAWVQDGDKPAGDDVVTPASVAAADFGCRFTLGERPFVPACPEP